MKVYEVRWDDSESYWVMASFLDREHAEDVLRHINPLLRDIDVDGLTIVETDVLESPIKLEGVEDIADWFESESWAAEYLVGDIRDHLEAMRSAPEDYTPEMRARWGVEQPPDIQWAKDEAKSLEMGL